MFLPEAGDDDDELIHMGELGCPLPDVPTLSKYEVILVPMRPVRATFLGAFKCLPIDCAFSGNVREDPGFSSFEEC